MMFSNVLIPMSNKRRPNGYTDQEILVIANWGVLNSYENCSPSPSYQGVNFRNERRCLDCTTTQDYGGEKFITAPPRSYGFSPPTKRYRYGA